jgi:hypothetical protein
MGCYDSKEHPDYTSRIIKYMYEGTVISINKRVNTSQKKEMINQGVRQDCPWQPTLFSVYMGAASFAWQVQLKSMTLLFGDGQVIFENQNMNYRQLRYSLVI